MIMITIIILYNVIAFIGKDDIDDLREGDLLNGPYTIVHQTTNRWASGVCIVLLLR